MANAPLVRLRVGGLPTKSTATAARATAKANIRHLAVWKTERLHRLQDLIAAQQREIQDQMVGRTVRVLFEKKGRFAGQMVGKSEYLHAVHVTSENVAIGSLESVRITKSKSNSLTGELI